MEMYLSDIPLDQALTLFREALQGEGLWQPLGAENVAVEMCLGRVTAEPIWARRSVPHYHASGMDGYALRGRSTSGASERTPVELLIPKEATYVDTGDALPDWADAVVPVEDIEKVRLPSGGGIRSAPCPPRGATSARWERPRSDRARGPGRPCTSARGLGRLAACGYSPCLFGAARGAIIPTGSELRIDVQAAADASRVQLDHLAAQVSRRQRPSASASCRMTKHKSWKRPLLAKEHDLVLLNAGSSPARRLHRPGDRIAGRWSWSMGSRCAWVTRWSSDDRLGTTAAAYPIIGVPGTRCRLP
jgi:putative molybdopterin biosynthesis protein